MDPASFAAELIARLEKLKREQETMSSLEERLQQIKEVSEGGPFTVPAPPGLLAFLFKSSVLCFHSCCVDFEFMFAVVVVVKSLCCL